MVKVFKTSYVRFGKSPKAPIFLGQLFSPEVVLATSYYSDTDIGKLVDPSGNGSHWIRLDTGIGIDYIKGKPHDCVFTGDEIEHSKSKFNQNPADYSGELVEDHAQRCVALERQFGTGVEQVVNSYAFQKGFVTSVGHGNNGAEAFTLETKFRAPRYFLPDEFPVNGNKFSDVRVYSEARKTGIWFTRSSGIFTPDGTPILIQDSDDISQILLGHRNSIKTFLMIIKDHYYRGDCYSSAQDLLEERADILTHVDSWDYRERQLMESARSIARAIFEESPLRGQVKEVLLYGSLARKDNIPGDIDLMLLVDTKDGQLNPLKYFSVDNQNMPKRYNVADVTNGIARELGIVPALLRIGIKAKDPYGELPDEAENIIFSDTGGGINLSVIPTQFLRDPTLREQYMRLCFTPTYFQDALTDGLAFDVRSGDFIVPTRVAYAGIIQSLKDQHGKAIIEKWPNVENVRPKKTF
ncbi:MAG: nucleotidyltransferase domain-containing protein [Nanoarchaeota archaeon]